MSSEGMRRAAWLRLGVLALAMAPVMRAAAEVLPVDRAFPLALDAPQSGDLASGDFVRDDNSIADLYRLAVRAGVRYRVTLESEAFDTYLVVFDGAGRVVLASNDDGMGTGTDSVVEFLAEREGSVIVVANSLYESRTGAYRVSATALAAAPAPRVAPPALAAGGGLVIGQPLRGELDDTDQTLTDDSYMDMYPIRLEAGTAYNISMHSGEFDCYLQLRDSDTNVIARNDDGPGVGTNSLLEFTPERSDTYYVVANSYEAGSVGGYELLVRVLERTGAETIRGSQSVDTGVRAARIPGVGRLHAIVVGLDYQHLAAGHLTECDDDAVYIAETLRSVVPSDQLRVHTLINDEATIANLRARLAQVTREAGPTDIVLFFYSGHGGQDDRPEASSERERDRMPEYLVLYDGDFYDYMLAEAMNGLTEMNCKLTLLAIDACYSGGFDQLIDRPGRMGLFSSQEYLVSGVPTERDEYNRLFGGHLTKPLCLALQGKADGSTADLSVPADGRVSVLEVEKYIRSEWKTIEIEGQYQMPVFLRSRVEPDTTIVATSTAGGALVRLGESVNQVFRERRIAAGEAFHSEDFTARAGRRYVLETSALTGGLDTMMRLRRSTDPGYAHDSDPVLTENDDGDGIGLASRIDWLCPADGMYYATIAGLNNSAGSFTLTIREAAGDLPADRLSVRYTDYHIAPDDPVHSRDFTLVAGRTYQVQTHDLTEGCDTQIQLRRSTDPSNAQDTDPVLAENDDGEGIGLASRLVWTCTESGDYYVTIRAYGETSGSFSLAIDELEGDAPMPAPVAPAASRRIAMENVRLTGEEPEHYGDYTLAAGQRIIVETLGLSDGCDTIIELRRSTDPASAKPDDPIVAENDDAFGSLASRLAWTVDRAGEYYVTVRAFEGSGGTCDLVVREAMPRRDAILARGLRVTEDQPVFRGDYQIEAGRRMVFQTEGLSEGCDTLLELRRSTDPDSAHEDDPVLETNDDADGLASRIDWVCPEDGAYYIVIRAFSGGDGTCDLRVRFLE